MRQYKIDYALKLIICTKKSIVGKLLLFTLLYSYKGHN